MSNALSPSFSAHYISMCRCTDERKLSLKVVYDNFVNLKYSRACSYNRVIH